MPVDNFPSFLRTKIKTETIRTQKEIRSMNLLRTTFLAALQRNFSLPIAVGWKGHCTSQQTISDQGTRQKKLFLGFPWWSRGQDCASNASGPSLISSQETIPHAETTSCIAQANILHAATKRAHMLQLRPGCSQVSSFLKKKRLYF